MCIVRYMSPFCPVLLCLFFAHAAKRQISTFCTKNVDNKVLSILFYSITVVAVLFSLSDPEAHNGKSSSHTH